MNFDLAFEFAWTKNENTSEGYSLINKNDKNWKIIFKKSPSFGILVIRWWIVATEVHQFDIDINAFPFQLDDFTEEVKMVRRKMTFNQIMTIS